MSRTHPREATHHAVKEGSAEVDNKVLELGRAPELCDWP